MDPNKVRDLFSKMSKEDQDSFVNELSDEEAGKLLETIKQPTEKPSLTGKGAVGIQDVIFGDKTLKEFAQNRLDAVKNVLTTNPAQELSNLPSKVTPQDVNSLNERMTGVALSVLPTTPMSSATRAGVLKPALTGADAVKAETLKAAGEAGYSVPRSNIKQTALTNLGERFGGKQAIEATAQIKNQPVTNKLAARALGLADDTPITPDLLSGIRDQAGKAYESVKNIGTITADDAYEKALKSVQEKYSGASKDFPELASESVKKLTDALNKKTISADGAIEQIKNLRGSAKANQSSAVAAERLLGKAQKKAADTLDDLIERNLIKTMGKDQAGRQIIKDYKLARQTIAKTYAVEKALNPATGNVNAASLAKQAQKGVPLSPELKQAATFAQGFPRLAREPIGAPASGGALEPLVYGTAGGFSSGGVGTLAAGIPIIGKPIARHLMTTVPKAKPPGEFLSRFGTQRAVLGTGLYLRGDNSGY